MWIAKPISTLTKNERLSWNEIESNLPLAQTLTWARAIEAIYGKTFLVFSPDERVGGMVFCSPHPSEAKLHFECINGPFLHWENPDTASRQLATFAMAVSRMGSNFGSLVLKPRWEKGQIGHLTKHLPLALHDQSHAATVWVPIKDSKKEQLQVLSSRLRRTLSLAWRNQVESNWEKLTPELLLNFVPALQTFGKSKGFTIPPLAWFRALIQESEDSPLDSPTFWLASSTHSEHGQRRSITQNLICIRKKCAHYLFGYELRNPNLRAAISTSAVAHWEALSQCASKGVQNYDLNGYMVEPKSDHPYRGVCQFKNQFGGTVIEYDVPEFLIE